MHSISSSTVTAKAFEVFHYGNLIDDYKIEVQDKFIRQKIYYYKEKLYIETWCNGIRIFFSELIE